jgi:hypothetical protein
MIRRLIDLVLILAVVAGIVPAWMSGQERSRLEAEYARLAKSAGNLVLTDPTLVHMLALDTGEPLHYAWRIYFPPGYQATYRTSNEMSGGSWNRDACNFIGRVRFQVDEQDRLQLYTKFHGNMSLSQVGDQALGRLVREGRVRFEVEQLGSKGVAIFGPDQGVILLSLTIPEDLPGDVREKLLTVAPKGTRLFYQFELGPKPDGP